MEKVGGCWEGWKPVETVETIKASRRPMSSPPSSHLEKQPRALARLAPSSAVLRGPLRSFARFPRASLVGFVHDDVDPAHGVLHHPLAQLTPELSKAFEGRLRELDRRLVPRDEGYEVSPTSDFFLRNGS